MLAVGLDCKAVKLFHAQAASTAYTAPALAAAPANTRLSSIPSRPLGNSFFKKLKASAIKENLMTEDTCTSFMAN